MNQVTNLSIQNILVLKTYLTSIYGDHWPLEIIQIICMLFYELFNVKVSCGYNHTCLVFDKQLYACGSNEYGQLGLGHNQNQNSLQKLNLPVVKKIICGGAHSIAVTGEEKVRNAPFSNPLGKMREHFSSTATNEVYVWGL